MIIDSLYIENFRLFKKKIFKLSHNKALISGGNSSGKTSILEALNILFLGKSFRESNLTSCIKHSKSYFLLASLGNSKNNELRITGKKSFQTRLQVRREKNSKLTQLNSMPLINILFGKKFNMIESQSELRRDFFNRIMFHVKPGLRMQYSNYLKTLHHRNKAIKKGASKRELLIWTKQLAEKGEYIQTEQKKFYSLFEASFKKYISSIAQENTLRFLEETTVKCFPGWNKTQSLDKSLIEAIDKDRVLGYTTLGPHRLDLIFFTNNKKSKTLLSRGQQKLLILLVCLSISPFLKKTFNLESVLMIDDISSELDSINLSIILTEIARAENQVLATLIDINSLTKNNNLLDQFDQINL